MEELVGSDMVTRAAGTAIEQVCGNRESVRPKSGGHGGLEQKATQPLGKSTDDSLGPAVLLRGIGAGEVKGDAMRGQKCTECLVIELTSIVTVKGEYRALELGGDEGMEGYENLVDIGFATKRERPSVVRVVIKDDEEVLEPGVAKNGGRPNITV